MPKVIDSYELIWFSCRALECGEAKMTLFETIETKRNEDSTHINNVLLDCATPISLL